MNLLSIAFAVLFVGLGVDFGIQFSVRYRSERFKNDNLTLALENAARRSAVPLSLAAMATAAGFLCFLPTDYKGISELGKIAGAGMLVAFITSITCCRRCSTCSIRRARRSRSATPSWRRSTTSWRSTAFRSSSARCWSRSRACRCCTT
nr:MMPL family transporter [Bradyrhizobium tropiciagri]